jgi:hypothetical protein
MKNDETQRNLACRFLVVAIVIATFHAGDRQAFFSPL